jgi:hypothetical protein
MVTTRSASKRPRSATPTPKANANRSPAKRPRSPTPNAKKRANFNFRELPPNSLRNIMNLLSPRNAVSLATAISHKKQNNRTRDVIKHALTGMKLKKLLNMGKHNHARYFSPTYAKIVRGITENNNAPMRHGYTVGYHRRRVKDSQAMLNALRINTNNNGLYSIGGTGTNKYRYNKRYGGTLSSVRGGTTRTVMKGIKRTPNGTGLMLRH